MNRSDARVIGTSAATAAVVALVTVIVYVKVTGAGQPTHVEPGNRVEVQSREVGRDTPTVGTATPSPEQLRQEMRELQKRLDAAEKDAAAVPVPQPTPVPGPAPVPGSAPVTQLGPQPTATAPAPVPQPAVPAPQPTVPGPQPTAPGPQPAVPAPEPAAAGPQPAAPAPASCDAEALAERGRDLFATGQLAAALQSFEQAYACKADPFVAEKAFIAACNLSSVPKARVYWARLPAASRQRVLAICVRNGIGEDRLNAASTPSATLKLSSRPSAVVYLDGRQVGKTPLEIEVEPGSHKVRFESGGDNYTFTVYAEAGKTVTLDKAL